MFQTILIGLSLLVIATIGYVLLKAYWNQSSQKDAFQAARAVPAPVVAPVAVISPEPPRVVAPAGPNPPNAAPPKKVTFAPEEQPRDPYDQPEGETPLRDSLRHPERSFGPGVENVETRISQESGVASNANGSFSPEFAQNGGEFMKGISANDMYGEATYANA